MEWENKYQWQWLFINSIIPSKYIVKVPMGGFSVKILRTLPFPLKWTINKISTLNTLHFWETPNIYEL